MQKIYSALCPPATSRLQWRIPTEEGVEAKLERERGSAAGRPAGAARDRAADAVSAREFKDAKYTNEVSFTGLTTKFCMTVETFMTNT